MIWLEWIKSSFQPIITQYQPSMNLIELIWLTHGDELKDVINAVKNDSREQDFYVNESLDQNASTLMTCLYVDPTFSEYSDDELMIAVSEAVSEYISNNQ